MTGVDQGLAGYAIGTLRRGVAGLMLCAMLQIMAPHVLAEDLPANPAAVLHKVLPAVVSLTVSKDEPSPLAATAGVATTSAAVPGPASPNIKSYVGSGFVIDPSGMIVTNYHVVENAYRIMVGLSDGTILNGKTLSVSPLADLAIVKAESAQPLTPAQWGDSDKLAIGDQVFAAGNPFGVGLSVSAGIVSALNRNIQNSPYDDYIQTDATINHGNSGGPLFDMRGDVVGIDSNIISPTTGSVGIGFAMPSNTVRFVVDRLMKYGWVRPAWIGVKLQQITPELAQAIGLTTTTGSLVAWVMPAGPAQQAGIAIGDVITQFNTRTPTDVRAMLRDIARTSVGDTITLRVQQGQQERRVNIVTEQWPRDQWERQNAPVAVLRPKLVIPPNLGLSLSSVPAVEKQSVGLENGLPGVMITGVLPDSDPARHGIVPGDIILRAYDKPVATPEDVQSAIDAARNDKLDYVAMLILPKVRTTPGPEWIGLRIGASTD